MLIQSAVVAPTDDKNIVFHELPWDKAEMFHTWWKSKGDALHVVLNPAFGFSFIGFNSS